MSFSSVGFSVRQQPTIMDCEKLIHLIQERKYLWDQKEPQYHMRNVQMKLWKEVATEMKEPGSLILLHYYYILLTEYN